MTLRQGHAMVCIAFGLLGGTASSCAAPVFSDEDRASFVAYWNMPGRYLTAAPPEAATVGPWQVRLTAEGSQWFLAYQQALGASKLPPGTDAPAPPDRADWESWVQARLVYDRGLAQAAADAANAAVHPAAAAGVSPAKGPSPGLVPASLLAAVGNPPRFAAAVTPMRYTVTFDDGEVYSYTDHVPLRPRFAYYRFPQGTVAYGAMLRDMPAVELDALFGAAGMSPPEQRVSRAVSRLEGGFDAVNTYDTGYVSVGFIQFVTLADGKGSLSETLGREKVEAPADFERDFHRFGVDVDIEGTLAVVDPSTGAELVGPAAVQKVIDDKRLTAAFQRAGRHSTAFRVAQIQVAKAHYWPADDPVMVTVAAKIITGKVSDVVSSEAGIATLFDRKVNRGNIRPFSDVLQKVMEAHQAASLAEAAHYEREIITHLRYRTNFLEDPSLSQPP